MKISVARVGLWFYWVLMFSLGGALAQTPSVAIYPFHSEDVLKGMAVSQVISESLQSTPHFDQVLGPLVSVSVVPILPLEGGYTFPFTMINGFHDNAIPAVATLDGAIMLREMLGVELGVTGQVMVVAEEEVLELHIATPQIHHSYTLKAPLDDLSTLIHDALATVLGVMELPSSPPVATVDLNDANHVTLLRALALFSNGFMQSAHTTLHSLETEQHPLTLSGYTPHLLKALDDVEKGISHENALLGTVVLLGVAHTDMREQIAYVQRWYEQTRLPLAALWLGLLKDQVHDRQGADAAFEEASVYPYGSAVRSLYRMGNGLGSPDEDIAPFLDHKAITSFFVASLSAKIAGETDLEKQLLTKLSRAAPQQAYTFERLSFLAFNTKDTLAATQALAVATELDPHNSLYWTNLGWAYYLLGLFDKSKEASVKATELNPEQKVAWFNLGLAQVVSGDLSSAMQAYERALMLDPDVQDEAIADLEEAVVRYTNQPAIHYALAALYEVNDLTGNPDKANQYYRQYLSTGTDKTFLARAEQRVQVINSPPAPLQIAPSISLGLGRSHTPLGPYSPGERLSLKLEVLTEGFELPSMLELVVRVVDPEKGEMVDVFKQGFELPQLDVVAYELPDVLFVVPNLGEHTYYLDVSVVGRGRRSVQTQTSAAQTTIPFPVITDSSLIRQLVSRGVVMRDLAADVPLYSNASKNLGRSPAQADRLLLDVLVQEVRKSVETAQTVLPVVEKGRFEGMDGGMLFTESSAQDIYDFIAYLLQETAVADVDFNFVDAYAQWAVDGAPTSEVEPALPLPVSQQPKEPGPNGPQG